MYWTNLSQTTTRSMSLLKMPSQTAQQNVEKGLAVTSSLARRVTRSLGSVAQEGDQNQIPESPQMILIRGQSEVDSEVGPEVVLDGAGGVVLLAEADGEVLLNEADGKVRGAAVRGVAAKDSVRVGVSRRAASSSLVQRALQDFGFFDSEFFCHWNSNDLFDPDRNGRQRPWAYHSQSSIIDHVIVSVMVLLSMSLMSLGICHLFLTTPPVSN